MPRRQRTEVKPVPWIVAFAGTGNASEENVNDLLDNYLPEEEDMVEAIVPEEIKRQHKALMAAWNFLYDFKIETNKMDPSKMVSHLVDCREAGHPVTLVLAAPEGPMPDDLRELARQATDERVTILDLCNALDELVWVPDEEEAKEPEQPRGRRGKPRNAPADVVEGTVDGPATPVQHQTPAIQQLGVALHNFVAEMLQPIVKDLEALYAGQHSTVAGEEDARAVKPESKIKAWYDEEEGTYELATRDGRAPRGKKTVELSQAEAREAGLNV